MEKPTLTANASLRALMTNEFHANGNAAFSTTEPEKYLDRLTDKQITLLNDANLVPVDSLTTFITFGDGFIDRPIGADFNLQRGQDSIRPNASFAMFFKKVAPPPAGMKLELVFYTRFFVISYQNNSGKARQKCRELDQKKMTDVVARNKLKKEIFAEMKIRVGQSYWNTPNRSWGPAEKSRRYGLVIGPVWHLGYDQSYFPYVYLKIERPDGQFKRYAPFMCSGPNNCNKIHGTIVTQGCWMLLRNITPDWPNENKNHTDGYQVFKHIMDCLRRMRRGHRNPSPRQCVTNKGIDPSNAFQGNFSYYQLLNLLGGLKYNKLRASIPAPIAGSFAVSPNHNCWKQCANDWCANVLGKSLVDASADPSEVCTGYHEKLWAYAYLFKRTAQFTPDFTLEPGAPNDKFS